MLEDKTIPLMKSQETGLGEIWKHLAMFARSALLPGKDRRSAGRTVLRWGSLYRPWTESVSSGLEADRTNTLQINQAGNWGLGRGHHKPSTGQHDLDTEQVELTTPHKVGLIQKEIFNTSGSIPYEPVTWHLVIPHPHSPHQTLGEGQDFKLHTPKRWTPTKMSNYWHLCPQLGDYYSTRVKNNLKIFFYRYF